MTTARTSEMTPMKSRWRVMTTAVLGPFVTVAAMLLEAGSQSLRMAVVVTTSVMLATALGGGLYLSARAFREAVQSSRHAVRTSMSPRLLFTRLQKAARTSQNSQQVLERDFNTVRQLIEKQFPVGDQRTTANN